MDNLRGNNTNRFSTHALYRHSATDCSCCNQPSAESSSDALQVGSAGEVPDLYYDQNWPSPISVTSSSGAMSTPPPNFQKAQSEAQCISGLAFHVTYPPQYFPLGPRRVGCPTEPPINAYCSVKEDISDIVQHSSTLGHENYELSVQLPAYPSHSQISLNIYAEPDPGVCLAPNTLTSSFDSPSSSALIPGHLANTPSRTPRPPLKIHQPRPFRKIPIVSLSDLASASDDFLPVSTRSMGPKVHIESGSPSCPSSPEGIFWPNVNFQSFMQHSQSACEGSTSSLGETLGSKVIACPCRCGEWYTFHY